MRTRYGVIIDDHQSAIDYLMDMLQDVAYVEIIATFREGAEAKRFLHVNPVDFLVLDVELGDTTGFDFLRTLSNPRMPTILYTGYEQYEDRGYDIDVVDVLLKPVSQSRLWGALRRLSTELARVLPDLEENLEGHYDFFQVKGPVRFGRKMVWLKNIVYLETVNGKVVMTLVDGTVLESNSAFKSIMERLPRRWFKQCYQNIAFNINFYDGYGNGQVKIIRGLGTPEILLPTGAKELYPDFYKFLDSNVI